MALNGLDCMVFWRLLGAIAIACLLVIFNGKMRKSG